jgi:hypothetical protein
MEDKRTYSIPANATTEELLHIIDISQNDQHVQRERAVRAEERLSQQQATYRHDMQHWEDTLRAAKTDQDWCDEGTNEVIEKLNKGFTGGWSIDPYLMRWKIKLTEWVKVPIARTFEVDALDEDDACASALTEAEENPLDDDTVVYELRSRVDPEHLEFSRRMEWEVYEI